MDCFIHQHRNEFVILPETQSLRQEALDGADIFSASSPLNSASASLVAILALCLVGVGGSAFGLGVLGFGAAFTFTSGLVSGLISTCFLGFALLPGLLPRERLRAGRFFTLTTCFFALDFY